MSQEDKQKGFLLDWVSDKSRMKTYESTKDPCLIGFYSNIKRNRHLKRNGINFDISPQRLTRFQRARTPILPAWSKGKVRNSMQPRYLSQRLAKFPTVEFKRKKLVQERLVQRRKPEGNSVETSQTWDTRAEKTETRKKSAASNVMLQNNKNRSKSADRQGYLKPMTKSAFLNFIDSVHPRQREISALLEWKNKGAKNVNKL